MSTQIVNGTVAVTNVEQLVCTLPQWWPLVDVYVDPGSDPLTIGTLWRVYAVTGANRTLLAEGQFADPGDIGMALSQQVLSKVVGSGTSLALYAVTNGLHTVATLKAVMVGWNIDPPGPLPEDVSATHAVNTNTLFGTLSQWWPRVAAIVSGIPSAVGSVWGVYASFPSVAGFASCLLRRGTLTSPAGQQVLASVEAGAETFFLKASTPNATTLAVTADILGFPTLNDSGAGGGGAGGATFLINTVDFVQPAIGAVVTVQCADTAGLAIGEHVLVPKGGFYTVTAIVDGTHVTLRNLGYIENLPELSTVIAFSPTNVNDQILAARAGQKIRFYFGSAEKASIEPLHGLGTFGFIGGAEATASLGPYVTAPAYGALYLLGVGGVPDGLNPVVYSLGTDTNFNTPGATGVFNWFEHGSVLFASWDIAAGGLFRFRADTYRFGKATDAVRLGFDPDALTPTLQQDDQVLNASPHDLEINGQRCTHPGQARGGVVSVNGGNGASDLGSVGINGPSPAYSPGTDTTGVIVGTVAPTDTDSGIHVTGEVMGRQGAAGNNPFALGGGRQLIAMPADADYTPTTLEYENPILRFASAVPLTATRTIKLPKQPSIYFVSNFTLGARALRFQNADGTGVGVTLANGKKCVIVWKGADGEGGADFVEWTPAYPVDLPAGPLDTVQRVTDADIPIATTTQNAFAVFVGLTANRTCLAPAAPATGQQIKVKDGDGSIPGHTIIFDGNGKNVENPAVGGTYAATANLPALAGTSVTWEYDGVRWGIS